MKTTFKFHHFGIATKSIEKSAEIFSHIGYTLSGIQVEPSQKVKIGFMVHENNPTLELVEPLDSDSPVSRLIQNSGTTPFHTCFEVPDIYEAIDELEDLNFRPLFEPLVSDVMDKGLFCYLYSVEIGLFELYQPTR
jgi:methylmalonyl-CoA/ethylmalonyl-CoA epimerase